MKRLAYILIIAICLWLFLFQGSSRIPEKFNAVQEVRVVEIVDGGQIMLNFCLFVFFFFAVFHALNRYVYWRKSIF